jgi:hypothetical protein
LSLLNVIAQHIIALVANRQLLQQQLHHSACLCAIVLLSLHIYTYKVSSSINMYVQRIPSSKLTAAEEGGKILKNSLYDHNKWLLY